jgi:hypothetical protein
MLVTATLFTVRFRREAIPVAVAGLHGTIESEKPGRQLQLSGEHPQF